jgi:hypothetical protein
VPKDVPALTLLPTAVASEIQTSRIFVGRSRLWRIKIEGFNPSFIVWRIQSIAALRQTLKLSSFRLSFEALPTPDW